jgi:hypothetical protein
LSTIRTVLRRDGVNQPGTVSAREFEGSPR